jgi:hypothetical protein
VQGYTFDLRYGLSDMVVIEMREASDSTFDNASQTNTRMIGIVFAPLPESVNGKPEKLWYKFKGVPPKVRESAGKVVPTLSGQVLMSYMITTSEIHKRLEHALDTVNLVEKQDRARSLIDEIRFSVSSKLKSVFSRAPLKQKILDERAAKKARDEQLRAIFLAKNEKKMQMFKDMAAKTAFAVAQPLVHLDLSSSFINDNSVIPVILQATNLTVLRLSHCQNLTPNMFAEIISDNVQHQQAPGAPLRKLGTLSMRNTPACDDSAIIRICSVCTLLHSLDIGHSQSRVTNAAVSVIAEGPAKTLKRLMMDSCPGELTFLSNKIRYRRLFCILIATKLPLHCTLMPLILGLSGNRRLSKHAPCSRGCKLQRAELVIPGSIIVCNFFHMFSVLDGTKTGWCGGRVVG